MIYSRPGPRARFTLIELLICISIILILAAILLPALGRVRYIAALALCSNNLHQAATGVALYTTDNNTRYPYRPVPNKHIDARADQLHREYTNDRPYIADYIPYQEILNDPVTPGTQNLELIPSGSKQVVCGYQMYWGWAFKNETGMIRSGESWTFKGKNSSVLAGDRCTTINSGAVSSHPDKKLMTHSFVDTDSTTASHFIHSNSKSRGTVDLNFAFNDGSVERYMRVTMNDSRMTKVGAFQNGSGYSRLFSEIPFQE